MDRGFTNNYYNYVRQYKPTGPIAGLFFTLLLIIVIPLIIAGIILTVFVLWLRYMIGRIFGNKAGKKSNQGFRYTFYSSNNRAQTSEPKDVEVEIMDDTSQVKINVSTSDASYDDYEEVD